MTPIDVFLSMLLIVMWAYFIIWELDISGLDGAVRKKLVRFDLILMPSYIMVTLVVVWIVCIKKRKR
jgi:hypothetical protein